MAGKFDMTNNDRYRLAMHQGETFTRRISVKEACPSEIFHLTDYTARMQVRSAPGATPIFSVTTRDGSDISCTLTDAGDVVTSADHYLVAGCPIQFTVINSTTGISINTTYYVKSPTATTFTLSATPGGAKINFHTDGTGVYHVLDHEISIQGDEGTADILIGAMCTALYPVGMYYWDILFTNPDGITTCLLEGKFEISSRITV